LKHRLEAAERRIREYQDVAEKEKEQSSEIGKLKRELDRTGRELGEAKLRYRENVFGKQLRYKTEIRYLYLLYNKYLYTC